MLTTPSLQYLLTVRPFVNDEEYTRLRNLAEEFQGKLGKRLQRYLWVKSWWSSNYVSTRLLAFSSTANSVSQVFKFTSILNY